MNRRKYALIMIVAVALLLAGCTGKVVNDPVDEKAGGENSGVEMESEKEGESAYADNKAAIKAVYIGRMDPSFVEVLYKGEYSSYLLHQDSDAAMEAGKIDSYSAVDLQYVIDKNGKRQIVSIEMADPPGVGLASEMQLEGEVESMFGGTVCMIESEPYWLAYELLLSSSKFVEEGDYIVFRYYVDGYGRKVITTYDKRYTDTGRFDSVNGTTIYVKLTGNPDEIDAKTFELTSEAVEMLEGLDLEKGEEIKFQYIVEQSGLKRISEVERMK